MQNANELPGKSAGERSCELDFRPGCDVRISAPDP